MKPDTIRANINVNKHEWELFKILCGKHLHRNEDGTARTATASDFIREYLGGVIENEWHHLKQVLADLKALKIEPTIIALLEESKKLYNENKKPEDVEWGT